jgi:hypothetical protein
MAIVLLLGVHVTASPHAAQYARPGFRTGSKCVIFNPPT